MEIAKRFHEIGYNLLAQLTAQSLAEQNISTVVKKLILETTIKLDIIRTKEKKFVINN